MFRKGRRLKQRRRQKEQDCDNQQDRGIEQLHYRREGEVPLGQLADDADLRARLGVANRARAARDFAEETMVNAYASLYGEALASPMILR